MGSSARAARPHHQVRDGLGDQRVGNNRSCSGPVGSGANLRTTSKAPIDGRGDPFELFRFVEAQDLVFDTVLAELGGGRKETHWIWFVFPQLRALGRSSTATFYGIGSIDEARGYLRHPVLAERLARAVDAVVGVSDRSAHEIFGSPDDLKLRSSMTLFSAAAGAAGERFRLALQRFFAGEPDPRTLDLLGGGIDSRCLDPL